MPQEQTTISDQIFSKCAASLSIDSSRCDGITGLNISPTTMDELSSIYKATAEGQNQWRIMGALLEADFVGRACYIKQQGMWDLIQATRRTLDGKKLSASKINHGLWELLPFVKMERRYPINNEYWNVSNGTAQLDQSAPEDATYQVTVTSQTGIPASTRWFPAGLRVHITSVTEAGTRTQTEYKVEGSAVDGDSVILYLSGHNNGPIGAEVLHTDPTTGLLVRGTPNVADVEKYCAAIPGLNTKQLTPFWMETTRYSIPYCELMEAYLQAIRANNPYFRQFGDVESVELARQIVEDFQKRDAWSFFFNKPLQYQTLSDYDHLQQILMYAGNTIDNPYGGRVIGRRANATGQFWQMVECGRTKDFQGQPFNIPEFLADLYTIVRVRQDNGLQVNYVECWTDSWYANQIEQAFIKWFQAKWQNTLRLNMDVSVKAEQGPFGTVYRKINLDYPRTELRIVTHKFFDDLLMASKLAGADQEAAGRNVWVLDWSMMYRAMIATNSVTNRSGDLRALAAADPTYMCVMRVPQDTQKLYSFTYTNVNECPQSGMIYYGMSDAVPSITGSIDDYGNFYEEE